MVYPQNASKEVSYALLWIPEDMLEDDIPLPCFEILRIIVGHMSRKSGTWFYLAASGIY